jgi:hypothetical protein
VADFDASPQLRPNAIVRSPLFPEPVKVILTQPVGADLRLIGTGLHTGRTYQPILSAAQLATLLVSPERQPFDGDSNRFRLGVEALRLGLATGTILTSPFPSPASIPCLTSSRPSTTTSSSRRAFASY